MSKPARANRAIVGLNRFMGTDMTRIIGTGT